MPFTPISRDDTEHGKVYYLASEVDAFMANIAPELADAKHARGLANGNGECADSSDTEVRALELITSTIAQEERSGNYGFVENEVVTKFNMYRKNHPQGSPLDHAKSAMHACAHQ